jgi:hypothetical protein
LLWIAAALTLITGYDYLAEGLKHIDEKPVTHGTRPATPTGKGDARTQAASSASRT